MNTMTTEELERLRSLYEASTPGSWRVEPMKGYCDDFIVTDHPDYQQKPHGNSVAETSLAGGHQKQNFMQDSAFIAAGHNAFAALLDMAMRALDAEITLAERDARIAELERLMTPREIGG